ncbi:hypothetical protein [Streptomyces griseocarneus]|uniref:hypothetical protein n=1 Tax=Streptomyces griseocarneus TaxID=51201 RepID=UPI00167C6CDD|nr:hypothetical protein [Streptomyces griseocarneus]MBZ6477966.1 hypothetical protein [Streptomyces griseocarneus]GHG54537.1 hypothetical protein GCM10018779_17590 [Streptomyces griseocarneus]
MDAAPPAPTGPPAPAQAAPLDEVAATARHIRTVISALHALDLGDTPPAPTYDATFDSTHEATCSARQEETDAAV